MNATESYQWEVNIVSGNGLMSSDNKRLLKLVLTETYVTICRQLKGYKIMIKQHDHSPAMSPLAQEAWASVPKTHINGYTAIDITDLEMIFRATNGEEFVRWNFVYQIDGRNLTLEFNLTRWNWNLKCCIVLITGQTTSCLHCGGRISLKEKLISMQISLFLSLFFTNDDSILFPMMAGNWTGYGTLPE